MKLPIHILKSINANETSIGNNPALPPDDENKFLMKLIKTEFEELTKDINNNDDIRQDLSLLLTQCQKNESNNIPSLEELCINTINKIIQIPEDTIYIEAKIVNKIEVKQQRMMPEQTDDFSFDSIDDINYLTDEIYKRRFLNALVNGASLVYANNVELYLSELYKINPELPSIYNKIMKYNTILLYTEKDTFDNNSVEAGNVDVYIQSEQNMVKIKSQGLIFPILFAETIKGILELAISHGLPKNIDKAEYVIKKSDFKIAENWDNRIGIVLWKRINYMLNNINIDIDEIGINFLFMQLSMLSAYDFNKTMQEVLAGTKQGEKLLHDIIDEIIQQKEEDDFNDYINQQNSAVYQITDSDYFEPNELIADSL